MLKEVWEFLKKPQYIESTKDTKAKTKIFLKLVFLAVVFSGCFALLIEGITTLVGYSMENHAAIELFKKASYLELLFLVVILAPLLEELIFRAPLGLFKKSDFFKYAYYISVLLFGLIHIWNFGDIAGFYWLIPVLVAPQLVAGIFLGFIRTKLGVVWSILLHAAHNLILSIPYIIMKLLDIPFE